MLKAVFFDLDGTLLPMDEGKFTKEYFKMLYDYVKHLGYTLDGITSMIWTGMAAMYKNDGSRTNSEAFWSTASSVYGDKVYGDKEVFDRFYETKFYDSKEFCGKNGLARKIIDFIHESGISVALTTNPVFPTAGTIARMSFVGLNPNDFSLVTTYDNSSYCKPNPKYFEDVLNKLNLKSDEVILFGNNTKEDGDCASAVGIKVYLVRGNIIYDPKAKGTYEEINMEDIIPIIKKYL